MLTIWRMADPLIILVTLAMLGLGLLGVLSAGAHLSVDHLHFFFRQLIFASLGLILLGISASIDYTRYRFKTHLPYLLAILLLAAVIFFGRQSWLSIGMGFHFQPSEFAKLIIIIYLSYVLSFERFSGMQFFQHSLPIMFTCGLLIFLTVLQPDFGTALIMSLLTAYMLWIGCMPLLHLLIPAAIVAPLAVIVPFIFPYVRMRIYYFIISILPHSGPGKHLGYHDLQLRLAMGSGGLLGRGFGLGLIKRSFLPASHTDSIFTVLVEEGGFLTGLAVVCLFFALFLLGERTARYAHDRFGAMLARGIVFYIAIQAFLNIGVCLGLFPNTGVTLPLFSYGGSSMIVTLCAIGILINVSSQRRIFF